MKLRFALSKQALISLSYDIKVFIITYYKRLSHKKVNFSLISFFKETVVLITSIFCVQAVFM